jgi:tetratricopeptide (TPR) repeat protein
MSKARTNCHSQRSAESGREPACRVPRAACPPVLAVAFCFIIVALSATAYAAPPNWWNEDWPYRVRIECDPGEGDVAWVRVVLAGRTTPDGRDLRLVDDTGKLRNFEIIHHDPDLDTLIQFRTPPDEALKTWLYFGNVDASPIDTLNAQFEAWQEAWNAWKQNQAEREKAGQKRDMYKDELLRLRRRLQHARQSDNDRAKLEERITRLEQQLEELKALESEPAPSRPDAWYPRRGVLLWVYRKSDEMHPQTLSELRRLIRHSTLEGACFTRGISDGFNRFGPSDNYVSVYEGYLRIDEADAYQFCTVSDDGSWLRVNDRTVVEWPGEHGWGGAEHGEKNGEIGLRPGAACVQYYHEEGSGQQMAFVGWKPSGQESFSGIPPEQWLTVREARASAYQARDKPVMAVPLTRVINTYWVRDSDDRQATLVDVRDRSNSRAGKIVKQQWSFGDGLEAEEDKLRHVYFRTGRPALTLTVTDAAGNSDSIACRPSIFYVDVDTRYFRSGNAKQYTEAAAGYDVEHLAREDLLPYAEFWGYLEEWPEHVRAVDALMRRFPDEPAIPELAASAARGCMQAGAYDPQRAEGLYQLALEAADTPLRRAQLELRRAEVVAWGLEDPERARALLDAVLATVESKTRPAFQRLHRQTVIALGDVALLSGDYGEAERLYRQAQEMIEEPIGQAEMLAKTGGYGYTVDDLLARGEFDWALETLDRWERELPVQKLEGYTFFVRGKVLFVQRPGPLALRYLELAECVSPRAVHVPEAVWLRANCLLEMKRPDEALALFQRIRNDFTNSDFFEQADEKIKLCQSEIKSNTTSTREE